MKKFMEANNDINLDFLQIRLTSVGPRLPSSVTLLFYIHIGGVMSRISKMPINNDCDEDNHNTLVKRYGR